MDEPLGALDTEMREAMIRELRALHDRLGATTVYVTHDQLEAMAMADIIAVMNNGVVEQVASPRDIYDRPASLFVADFIGSPPMNFLPFRGSLQPARGRSGSASATSPFPRHARRLAESDLVLGVRPEHVRFTDRGMVRGEVYGCGISRHDPDRHGDDALRRAQGPRAREHFFSNRRDCRARLPPRYAVDVRQGDRPGDPYRVA